MNLRRLLNMMDSRIVVVAFGAVLLCCIWAGLYFKVEAETQIETAHAVEDTTNYTRTFSEHTARTIAGMDQIALFLKYQAETEGLHIDIPKLVRENLFAGQPFVQLGIADENGDSIISSVVPFVRVNIKDLEHFYTHRDKDSKKLFIGKPMVGRTSGKASIQLTRRINKADGSFGGVVVVSVDPYYFTEFYKQIDIGRDAMIGLVGADGIVRVLKTQKDSFIGLDFRQHPIIEKLAEAREGSFAISSKVDGIRRIYSYRMLYNYPLLVGVGMSETEVFRKLNQRIDGYYKFCSLVSVVVVIFVALLLRDIKRRRKAEAALVDNNENLERKVEARTQELQGANEELTAQNEEMSAMQMEITAQNEELIAINEEMTALTDNLQETNRQLEEEMGVREQKEAELLLRNQQYQSTARLLVGPADQAENLIQVILQEALHLVGAPEGFIGLFDQSDKSYAIHYAIGLRENEVGKPQPALSGLREELLRTGAWQWTEDYRTHPNRAKNPAYNRVTTVLTFPLQWDNRIAGTICVYWLDEPHALVPDAVDIMKQYSVLAAVALKNYMMHEKLRTLAFQDTLTGLPNRASLAARLEAEMAKARRGESAGAVIFIDLDDLKVVNDNYGHTFGDAVIVTAGRNIVDALAPGAFVSRIGGDEFVVILPGAQSRENLASQAESLVRLLSQEYAVSGERIHLSASLGVAFYPEDGYNPEDILKKADSAMYAAKNAGKDCWRFYESRIGDEVYTRMVLSNSLRRVLDRKELFLEFQPQVSCDKRRIVGFEALLRWSSPEHGAVSPAMFIPLAEQSGLIHPIGQFVLSQASLFIRKLNELGFPALRVAVNISPRQLAADDFVGVVSRCIEEHGIEASQLELEVTETELIESMHGSVQKLLALKELGVFLALDDFGTGYSSLTYLRHLPVHTLKIDKTFIDPIPGDDAQERFVRFIIEMAHSLNLLVVAEGVEKKSQVARLERLSCDIIQGYIYSRPVSEEEAIQMLRSEL